MRNLTNICIPIFRDTVPELKRLKSINKPGLYHLEVRNSYSKYNSNQKNYLHIINFNAYDSKLELIMNDQFKDKAEIESSEVTLFLFNACFYSPNELILPQTSELLKVNIERMFSFNTYGTLRITSIPINSSDNNVQKWIGTKDWRSPINNCWTEEITRNYAKDNLREEYLQETGISLTSSYSKSNNSDLH